MRKLYLLLPGVTLVALDRDADLPEAGPGPEAAQEAVALRDAAEEIDDAARHEAEVAGVERELDHESAPTRR